MLLLRTYGDGALLHFSEARARFAHAASDGHSTISFYARCARAHMFQGGAVSMLAAVCLKVKLAHMRMLAGARLPAHSGTAAAHVQLKRETVFARHNVYYSK